MAAVDLVVAAYNQDGDAAAQAGFQLFTYGGTAKTAMVLKDTERVVMGAQGSRMALRSIGHPATRALLADAERVHANVQALDFGLKTADLAGGAGSTVGTFYSLFGIH